MESTSENAAIASEQRIVLDENSWPHNVTDPTVHPDQTNKSNEDSNTSNTNDVFVPEKLTTVEYIERGDIKEFVYTKYEERDKNEFDRLYLRRSWAPVRPKSDIDEPKRFTIAHDTIGRDQTDTCKEQTSPVRRGAIESLKQILESEAEQAKPSTNEKNLNNLEDNASNYKNPTKLSPEIVEKLKTKYSPSSYGYPKLAPLTSPGLTTKIPVLFNSKPIPQPRSPQSPKQEVNSTDYNNNNNKPEKELDKSKPSPNPKPRYLLEKQKIVVTNIEKRPVNETTKSRSKDSLDSDFPSDVSASDAKRHHVYLCPKRKIPIINSAIIIKDPPTKEEESTESEEEERVVIVRHSSSEDSVDKVDGILSQFVMDKKATEKKRSNSFRRLFKGTFFGRDKKKDEDKDKNSRKLNDQTDASVENSKNSFVRHSVHRHTVDGSYKTENLLNGCDNLGIKSNSDNANYKRSNHKRHNGRSKSYIADGDNSKGRSILNDYLPMDTGNKDKSENKTETYINVPNINKYIDASSSSSDSHNNTYENSLIAQAELRQAQELGRKQRNVKSGIPVPSNGKVGQTLRNQNDSPQHFTETPPRAQETYQNVQLIKPKALIPINSERPLPNPYRHKKPTASQSESMSETSKDENQEVLRNNLNLEIKSYVSKSYSSEASPQSPVSPNRENPYLNDIYGEPRDTLNRKEKQSKQELVKPAVPVRNSSLERQSDNQQSSSPGNQSVKSSPVIKPKPVNVPLEVKISPVSSKLSDSPLSPRSRDSYVGVRGSPISRNLKSPVSPLTLERTKLKLPSNREKVELQPRVKSPIPKTKVSTDKIIATELLRNSKEHSEQKQSEQRTIPDGERSKLVITRANSSTKTAVTSPTKLPRPPAQRNILQEMQVDSREAKQNDTSNSQSRHPSNYLINKSQQIPQQLPVTPQSQINVQPISSSTPKLLNYQAVRQLSPKEPVYQYSNGIVPLRQPMLHSPQQPNQYSQSNGQSLSPAQFQYLRQNIYVNTKVPEKVSPKLTPEELEERRWRNMEANKNMSLMSLHNSNSSVDPQRASISNFSMSSSNISPRTRSSLPPESSQPRSPQKQQMLQNVEAFYWRELKKMKEKEELDFLNYRRLYGYVEDPVVFHRSRSSTPSNLHNSRRSLSLPREVKSTSLSCPPDSNINYETINRNDRIQEHVQYIPVQNYPQQKINIATYPAEVQPGRVQNQNFVRRSSGRNTIGPIGSTASIQTIYENYPAGVAPTLLKRQQLQNPIFRRGSLVSNPSPLPNYPVHNQYKKVSFGSQGGNTSPAWPTKNGYTQSPPQRRLECQESLDDDVFLPNSPRIIKRSERATSEPVYGSRFPNESPSNVVYGQVQQQTVAVVAESPYGHAIPKQITVTNKVCDMYGQIHDNGEKVLMSPENYGQVKQTGIIYGTLQPNVGSRLSLASRQSNSNLSEYDAGNFVRGTRLTASVNDMYRRYSDRQRLNGNDQQRYINETMRNENMSNVHAEAPTRPLPPLPPSRRSRSDQLRKAVLRGNPPASDNESSGSEAGEIQRILQTDPRNNRINAIEEEWSSDGKQGRGTSGGESGGQRNENDVSDLKGGSSRSSRAARREDPRRHTLGGAGDQRYHSGMSQGGPLSRTMDLEGQLSRGYNPHSNAMLFDDDPGIMSEVETSSTGFRRGGKQRSSLPVVRTPSKTLERPLGLVFLQYRNETKRALLPNEITSIDTVKALFVRSFPKQLSMEYLDSPLVKIYIHDSSKDMFYELEDVRSHLREIRDRSVLRLFESTDVSGGLPMVGVGIPGGIGHFEDPSYFSEPEFDSEYQHQHIHKSKGSAGKAAPYYMGSTTSLPRGGPLLRPYSPAVGALPPKSLAAGAPPKPQRAYSSGVPRASEDSSRTSDRFAPFQRPVNPLFNLPDGYMSSPERGSRGYEDPYYSQYSARSGSITPVIDEEVSDTELMDEQYSLYGVKMPPGGGRPAPRAQFPGPAAPPYDSTRIRVEHMERQLANLTGLVQKALTQTPTPRDFLTVPGNRENYRTGDEFDKNSSSSSASLPDDSYLRTDNKTPKLGKSGCHKSVSFEKSVSFSDEPPDMNSPKQHSPQHAADTKPPKPAIKSSTLPRTSSQEKDKYKPAPPPKPASLSPGQYEGRLIYRDLQLTPEMYNQLRGLQKKAKDLRSEVRNLRRMSQAQAHSVRESIRDTFIKIRAMLLAGGEQIWQAGMDQERVRLTREEDLYKQEMLRLEKDLTDLEASVEELRGNVINRKTRVNMSDVENMALVLSKSSKTVADLKLRFPGLQDSMKAFLSAEMDKVMREEKFLKEEPERLESALRRCKKLTGTLVTLKRLASVQEQRLPCSTPPASSDGRVSPTSSETPPVTPSGQHSKPSTSPRMGTIVIGGDGTNSSDSCQRPENALDALLDELQTFSKPHPPLSTQTSTQSVINSDTSSDPPAIPVKGIPATNSSVHFTHPPTMSEIGRKGSMDSATFLPTQNLTISTIPGNLRRLHSYPSGSDTDNSPPIQPLQRTTLDPNRTTGKPPIPERNAELLQHLTASGKRIPPPPPPRTSSKSPLASPTSPSLPPRSPAVGLQHIQNVQNMSEKGTMSQFEAATQNLGLSTLRRNIPNRSMPKDNKSQTLPRNIGSNLSTHQETKEGELQNVSSSSCESVNSQDGSKKGTRKEELEQRHKELLKKQKALQEQYARLQQLQRGNNTLAVVPPPSDQLLKKTGSESNLIQKMGLQMSTTQMTGSLTHLPSTSTITCSDAANKQTQDNSMQPKETMQSEELSSGNNSSSSTTSKVYETDIL